MLDQIPAFLDRRPKPGATMSAVPATTEAPKTRTRRADCYTANVKIQIPLDMSDAESLSAAIGAVKSLKDHLPSNAVITSTASLGKM